MTLQEILSSIDDTSPTHSSMGVGRTIEDEVREVKTLIKQLVQTLIEKG